MEQEEIVDKSKWIIVYCEDDTSFSLIEKGEAVFDADFLTEGDKVTFFYDGKEYAGDVRAMGGDDDYDDLLIRLHDLNAKNKKKDDSFHAERPRKNRGDGKFTDAVNSLKPRSRVAKPKARGGEALTDKKKETTSKSVTANNVSKAVGKKVIGKAEEMVSGEVEKKASGKAVKLSDSSSSEDSDSSSSSSSPSPEEVSPGVARKAAQAKRKGRDDDIKTVKKLKLSTDTKQCVKSSTNKTPLNISNGSKRLSVFGSGSFSIQPNSASDSEDDHSANEQKEGSEKEDGSKKEDGPVKDDGCGNQDSSGNEDGSGKEDESEKEDKMKKKSEENGNKNSEEDDDKKSEEDENKKSKKKKKKSKEDEKKDSKKKLVKKSKKAKREDTDEAKAKDTEVDFKVLRWSADDDDVEAVVGKSKDMANKKFYVLSDDLLKAKAAKNASTYSKTLLVAAFTDEALYKCSVSGGQYRAAGRDNITQKPPLPASVIAVIIDVALHRQGVKNWNPKLSKKEILAGLRQKLVDVRPRIKKLLSNV